VDYIDIEWAEENGDYDHYDEWYALFGELFDGDPYNPASTKSPEVYWIRRAYLAGYAVGQRYPHLAIPDQDTLSHDITGLMNAPMPTRERLLEAYVQGHDDSALVIG